MTSCALRLRPAVSMLSLIHKDRQVMQLVCFGYYLQQAPAVDVLMVLSVT